MRPRIPIDKNYVVKMSQWDRKVLKAAFKIMEGKRKIKSIMKVSLIIKHSRESDEIWIT